MHGWWRNLLPCLSFLFSAWPYDEAFREERPLSFSLGAGNIAAKSNLTFGKRLIVVSSRYKKAHPNKAH